MRVAPAGPAVDIETIESGLTIPWDLVFLPDGSMLFNELAGQTYLRSASGVRTRVRMNQSDVSLADAGGLRGMTIDPAFATNRLFYTCQSHLDPATSLQQDVRVVRWRLTASGKRATRVGAPVVAGIPLGEDHSGCRIRFGNDGMLYVGTGDGGVGTNPQSLNSLGGKILRVNADGTVPADNPYAAGGGRAAYVWNKGHRNIQGLARRPGTDQMWSVEHGPDRDDEVNLVLRKANYGWNPVPGYNQDVPMTDLTTFPNATEAAWSSGVPTLATSGATFLKSPSWRAWNGALAVGLLKDMGVMILTIGANDVVTGQTQIPELDDTYGRIRTAQLGPLNTLYLTTSNGRGTDLVLKVTPR